VRARPRALALLLLAACGLLWTLRQSASPAATFTETPSARAVALAPLPSTRSASAAARPVAGLTTAGLGTSTRWLWPRVSAASPSPSTPAAPSTATTTSTTVPAIAPTTTTTTQVPAPSPTPTPTLPGGPSGSDSSDANSGPWAMTARCEEGGRNDARFGYFGIYEQSWVQFGGLRYASSPAGATWDEQVAIGMAIEGHPPDEGRCEGGW
jgi:hypothetical protein